MSDLPLITLLLGDESHSRKQAEEELVGSVFGDASPGFNLATFTASDGAERAVDVAKTVPMMAKHRVVVVRDLEMAPIDLLDDLMRYAEKPNPSTVMILNGKKTPPAVGGVDRGRRLEGAIKKVGQVLRFKTGEKDPVRFARSFAEQAGCEMDHRTAQLLVELVGGDLGRVAAETNKVIAYVGGTGAIRTEDVEAVCSLVAEAVVWDLTDAVVRRDPDRALSVAHRLLETGDSSHRLMAMITWQIRQLITLQDCMQRRLNPKDVGLRMPYRKMEAAQQALRRQPINTVRILEQIAEANSGLNRARGDGDRRIFEGLLLALTTGL
jgi:DNA polymerase-3 subunit delta